VTAVGDEARDTDGDGDSTWREFVEELSTAAAADNAIAAVALDAFRADDRTAPGARAEGEIVCNWFEGEFAWESSLGEASTDLGLNISGGLGFSASFRDKISDRNVFTPLSPICWSAPGFCSIASNKIMISERGSSTILSMLGIPRVSSIHRNNNGSSALESALLESFGRESPCHTGTVLE
jgi:hypothetical protein